MNLLLSGQPRSGKSTLMRDVLSGAEKKQGFLTQEIARNGKRIGFELVSALGDRALLADEHLAVAPRVSRYGVDVASLERFLARLRSPEEGELLYLDEIGQMQLFSKAFRRCVMDYLDAANPFVGTLSSVHHDAFTDTLRARDDVEIVDLTVDTRDVVRGVIAEKIAKYSH